MLVLILFSLVSSTSHASLLSNACPKCGNLDVPYPLSTHETCGLSNYKVYCKNGSLEFLSAEGFYYQILSINQLENRLIISPPLIQKRTCQSSDLSLGGLRIDDNSPFNISSRNTVMLFNCSDNILLSPLNCSLTSPCRVFEDKVKEGKGCRNTLCCSYLKDSSMNSHRIRIRVGGCSAYTSAVDLKSSTVDDWQFGIELQWLPPTETLRLGV
ncbi:wall-associated receptor kinase-like 20 [Coffea eugenioides]|uniref:wall-associated receptor kinase-like 20 n=1 Tax=Coffea eugenioides TaxID=49369 RepID=UPI000F6066B2|nr:wall-associated receptor kinase-like 20 [Coffea eugenioides]